jgi:hypothetical protein
MTLGGNPMAVRLRLLVGVLAASFALAACGGGGGGGTTFIGPGPTPGPAVISIAPTSLSFSGPGAAAQSFTVSSTTAGLPAPAFDSLGCAPVATITGSSPTLPATYTVTPSGNGSCSLVANVGHQAAAIGIVVGGGSAPALSGSTNTITVFVGGTAGSVTITASSGNLVPDTNACAGIAAIGGGGGASPQTFTIAPLAQGSCTLTVVDGASSIAVPITVGANPSGANALFVSPSAVEFASQNAPTQQATLTFSGNAGQVAINEDDCIGNTGKPRIAFVTLTGVAPGSPVTLPASLTVSPYGGAGSPGTCSIVFTSSIATQAVLTVIVH